MGAKTALRSLMVAVVVVVATAGSSSAQGYAPGGGEQLMTFCHDVFPEVVVRTVPGAEWVPINRNRILDRVIARLRADSLYLTHDSVSAAGPKPRLVVEIFAVDQSPLLVWDMEVSLQKVLHVGTTESGVVLVWSRRSSGQADDLFSSALMETLASTLDDFAREYKAANSGWCDPPLRVVMEGVATVQIGMTEDGSTQRYDDIERPLRIVERGGRYFFWDQMMVLRSELARVEGSHYVVYYALDGTGYMKVVSDRYRREIEAMPEVERRRHVRFMQHRAFNFETVTYIGYFRR